MWGNWFNRGMSFDEILQAISTIKDAQERYIGRPEWGHRPLMGENQWQRGYGRPTFAQRPELQRGYSPQGMGPRPEGHTGPPSWAPEVAQRGYNWAQSGQAGPPPWAQTPETPRPMTPRPVTPPVTRPNYGRDNLPEQARSRMNRYV